MILFLKENLDNKDEFIKDCVRRYIKTISDFSAVKKSDTLNGLLKKDNNIFENISLNKDIYGRPYIEGVNVKISISHSGNILTAILSDKDVGIDIEKIDTDRDYIKIAKRYFNESNYKICIEKADNFYDLWTKKEAYSKYLGKGINRQLLKSELIKDDNFTFTSINFIKGYIINIYHSKDDKLIILL
jgi:4'-phosphopantetheinyl transferase